MGSRSVTTPSGFWFCKFGPLLASELRRRHPRRGDKWYLDEVALTINKHRYWLWRAVDLALDQNRVEVARVAMNSASAFGGDERPQHERCAVDSPAWCEAALIRQALREKLAVRELTRAAAPTPLERVARN